MYLLAALFLYDFELWDCVTPFFEGYPSKVDQPSDIIVEILKCLKKKSLLKCRFCLQAQNSISFIVLAEWFIYLLFLIGQYKINRPTTILTCNYCNISSMLPAWISVWCNVVNEVMNRRRKRHSNHLPRQKEIHSLNPPVYVAEEQSQVVNNGALPASLGPTRMSGGLSHGPDDKTKTFLMDLFFFCRNHDLLAVLFLATWN